jgi:hypothetical protein
MDEECQYHIRSRHGTIFKNYESICDRQYQSETRSRQEISQIPKFADSIKQLDQLALENAKPTI